MFLCLSSPVAIGKRRQIQMGKDFNITDGVLGLGLLRMRSHLRYCSLMLVLVSLTSGSYLGRGLMIRPNFG
jgi:hypothetical protein